jgi:hypothetical protein
MNYVSCSQPLIYDLKDFSEYVDLNRFQFCFSAYSGSVLAIATSSCLVLTDEGKTIEESDRSPDDSDTNDNADSIRTVLEFNEDSGRATCMQWIVEGTVVSVGFESGLMVCFNCQGEELFEFKGHNTPVLSIRIARTDVHRAEPAVWVLHEGGLLLAVRN